MGRRNVVLDKMFQQGFISRAEMEEALKEQLLQKAA